MARKKKSTSWISRFKGILAPILVIAAVFSFTAIVRAHGGDSSLIHACIGEVNGRTTIVGVNDTCDSNEFAIDWIKNVFAGSGLSISRDENGATLSADLTYVQKRVSDSCTVGSAIRAINSDGTVECEEINSGWQAANESWTYDSATSFTVSGDQTEKYRPGVKIKLTQTSLKYFYIVTSDYSSGTTTVTITGGSDYSLSNASITSPYFSYQATPQGFPDWFNWSPTLVWDGTAPSNVAQSIARFTIIGRTVFIRLKYEYSTAGSNNRVVFFAVPVRPTNAQTSEYNIPGSGYMSTGVAGTAPTISNHVVAQYGQQSIISPGEIYLIIDSGAAIKSVWASLFYEI